jgi:phytoene dehydrogenase-like protein
MSERRSYGAVVIGAGVNGLAAAAYLALAGKSVLTVEARDVVGGMCGTTPLGDGLSAPTVAHALYALDSRMVKELRLARRGLRFAVRDMDLVGLRTAGKHVVLTRDLRATARSIAVHSKMDADAWPDFRRELLTLGRAMRALWWEPGDIPQGGNFEPVARTGVAAWLDSRFESDALKATLGFDANALSPLEPGSALLIVWRAAQEMCGLQGAVAFPVGGPGAVASALASAAKEAGAEMRTGVRAAEILVENGVAAGVRLESGETIDAPLVLSSLGRRETLLQLSKCACVGLAERTSLARSLPATSAAKVLLALDSLPVIGGVEIPKAGRYVLADRLESYATAHAAARAGRMPDELTMEVVVASSVDATLAPAGSHVVSILVRPVPSEISGGWENVKAILAAKVVAALERFFPGIARHIVAAEVLTPDTLRVRYGPEQDRLETSRMLLGWRELVCTPVKGLFLCGADPVGGVSGRAGRIAATLALRAEAAR